MFTIYYEKIFSNFRGEVDDLFLANLEEYEQTEILTERLHEAFAESYFRRCFSSLKLDDDNQRLNCELKHSVDEDADKEFVIHAATLMMVYKWWGNKVNTTKLTAQAILGAEQKMFSQSAHSQEMRNGKADAKEAAMSYILARNTMCNSRIGGDRSGN